MSTDSKITSGSDFQSPERRSSRDSQMDTLVGSMSSVKLESSIGDHVEEDTIGELPVNHLGAHKRINRDSIEGSPFILKKRTNLQTTPIAFQNYREQYIAETELVEAQQIPDSIPILSPAPSMPLTVIFSGSDEHNTGDHQENSRRTKLLVGEQEGCLRRASLQSHIHWIDADTIAAPPLTDLLRVHEYEYLEHLERKCRQASGHTYENIPFFYSPAGRLDTDTPLTDQSLEAAKRFCGASIAAVDILLENHFHAQSQAPLDAVQTNTDDAGNIVSSAENSGESVFVIGRPPGHHAGPNGCVPSETYWKAPGMTSSGFCLLNTVAIAAAYARNQYGRMSLSRQRFHPSTTLLPTLPRPPRIAIVDIDIHHGNGTEEIVRNLRPRQVFLPLPSSWAPQSKRMYKPWLNDRDAEEVLFSSVHLFNHEEFYPGSGLENPDDIEHHNIVNITLTPIHIEHGKPKANLSKAKREDYMQRASTEFRHKMQHILFPALARFQADILFISAGFDAHFDDYYHFLSEEDIHWVTQEMRALCQRSNPTHFIGTVSVLEGGYSLESLYDKHHDAAAVGSAEATIGGRKRGAAKASSAHPTVSPLPAPIVDGKFAQRPGDGGLVKSVLAHAAALSGKKTWN